MSGGRRERERERTSVRICPTDGLRSFVFRYSWIRNKKKKKKKRKKRKKETAKYERQLTK